MTCPLTHCDTAPSVASVQLHSRCASSPGSQYPYPPNNMPNPALSDPVGSWNSHNSTHTIDNASRAVISRPSGTVLPDFHSSDVSQSNEDSGGPAADSDTRTDGEDIGNHCDSGSESEDSGHNESDLAETRVIPHASNNLSARCSSLGDSTLLLVSTTYTTALCNKSNHSPTWTSTTLFSIFTIPLILMTSYSSLSFSQASINSSALLSCVLWTIHVFLTSDVP